MTSTQSIVNALYKANSSLALKKSLMHCHVRGLHSVVLAEGVDGKLVRMFVASQTHAMTGGDSLAFHTHHCDITLTPILGTFTNMLLTEGHNNGGKNSRYKKYRFESPLKKGHKGRFKPLHDTGWCQVSESDHSPGADSSLFLKADQFHSVRVSPNTSAAWLVVEGEENPERPDYVFSNEKLQDWLPDNFYKPFDKPTLDELVSFVVSYAVTPPR